MTDEIASLDAVETPRYCLRCGAPLPTEGYFGPTPRCSECGLQFDPDNAETWASAPPTLAKMAPGVIATFLFATLLGTALYSIILYQQNMGEALFFVLPISLGMIVGFLAPASKWPLYWLVLMLIISIPLSLMTAGAAGLFCGAMVGVIFFLPLLFGAWLGKTLRRYLVRRGWNTFGGQRYFCVAVFSVLPLLANGVEKNIPRLVEINEVSTSRTFNAPAAKVWHAVAFYEEVTHEPPLLLKLALPLPQKSIGDKTRAGNRIRCLYNNGHYLVKRIDKVEKERLLAFTVIEQHIHFEHDLKLRDGSFIMEPLDAAHTRVVLTTRYERLTHPAFLWRWPEEVILHTMHEHVLNGMELKLNHENN